MGNAESNESAAVKRQAEGFSNPMYRLLDLGVSFLITFVRFVTHHVLSVCPVYVTFVGHYLVMFITIVRVEDFCLSCPSEP